MFVSKMGSSWSSWLLLLSCSALVTAAFYSLHIPASLLLGPMLTGIGFGLCGSTLRLPKKCLSFSQAILGAFLAQSFSITLLRDLASFWHVAIFITASTLLISVLLGLFLTKSALPSTTGIWGILPGGASAMVAISGDYGADIRLVAFIQYLRVITVLLLLALVSHLYFDAHATREASSTDWLPTPSFYLPLTLLIACCCSWVSKYFKIPSGHLMVPMLVVAFLHLNGWLTIEIPPWLLVICFAMVGLTAGLRFDFAVLRFMLRTLPWVICSILLMVMFCGLQALMLSYVAKTDFLTAFLATSPGGIEASVVVAMETNSNLGIILPLQVMRLFSVLLFGPSIARFLSLRVCSLRKK